MPKYLYHGSYTADGAEGVLKEGGSARARAAAELIESVGGTLEAIYWTFGHHDFVVIADMPDQAAAAAVSLKVGTSGTTRVSTTPLLTAADVDEIAGRSVSYRPPGA
jgi:uncharacterized protein with GYD domain